MIETPWPHVEVAGRLDNAEKEWLHVNGAGAYAMSTVATMHTRRYHGLLVAALSPPRGRHTIVSHVEARVTRSKRSYRLATYQFPDTAPTPGYRLLESFSQDPLPRWTYRLGRATLEQTLCLARGHNTVVLRYAWRGRSPVRLSLRPLLALRDAHDLVHEHGAMVQRVTLTPGHVQMQPVPDLPEITFRHEGVFIGSPEWYRRFEYTEDRTRDVPSQEDLWTPGLFEMTLRPRSTVSLMIGTGELPDSNADEIIESRARELLTLDPGMERPASVRQLLVAADQFRGDACDRPAVVGGWPWLEAETRDTLIGLPGLYLAAGRIDAAIRALDETLSIIQRGLRSRPSRGAHSGHVILGDAPLWLFETARVLLGVVGARTPFVRERLYPALAAVFDRIVEGHWDALWLTSDGLVANDADQAALTWTDARAPDGPGTRRGLAVELQALWSQGCRTLAYLAHAEGDSSRAAAAESASRRATESFRSRFWNRETGYPYDCVGENAGLEAAIRPNALLALDFDPSLFEGWQARAIVARVREHLLVPRGIRSLAPDHPDYRGEYAGGFHRRRAGYRQGLAWTHLLGAYGRAALRVAPDDFELAEDLRVRIETVVGAGPVLGQVAQLADGEPPHRPGGCPAHAWSVAELLRTLVWDLNL